MKKLFILSLSIITVAIACTPKTPTPPAPQVPSYVGTYVGRDSIQTYINGVLNQTNVVNNNFVVIESTLPGKNVYLLGYKGQDTVKANFANSTISYFDIGFNGLPFNGTYGNNEITAFEDYTYNQTQQTQANVKSYGLYKKQ